MEHPPTLTVLVRSRARVPTEIQARVVEGALDSEAVLEDALEGVDTVVSFLVGGFFFVKEPILEALNIWA